MIRWIRRKVLRGRAFDRWFRRNPPLRFATLATRQPIVRYLAMATPSLWLTPALYEAMRPLRRMRHLVASLGFAGLVWTLVVFEITPIWPALTQTVAELGAVTGWWSAEQAGRLAFSSCQALCFALVLAAAAVSWFDLAVARWVSERLRVPPPAKVRFGYFVLISSGNIAAMFALTWAVLKLGSPPVRSALFWLNDHPVASTPLVVVSGFSIMGGWIWWQMTLAARNRQIYGEGGRPLAYTAAAWLFR